MTEIAPKWHSDAEACVDAVLSKVGKDIVLALPLGLGKANSIANALYERAANDPTIQLEIFTALTLGRPRGKTELERRFLDPLFDRLAGNSPELAYNQALEAGCLPSNISVQEFYFPAGRRLNIPLAQRSYTSTNYTHAARDLLNRGVNVIAQLVAARGEGDDIQLSLSCNPDITLDILPELKQRQRAGQQIAIVGQVNEQLPFMLTPAVLDVSAFDFLLHGPDCQFDLFAVPKQPVSLTDYAAALHVATLVEDGGTLQIGIGGFSDALTHALKLRHLNNGEFQRLIGSLDRAEQSQGLCHLESFEEGLYANSEMLVEGLLELKRIGVVKRRVSHGPDRSKDGHSPMIHAAFFLGSKKLYRELRDLTEDELSDIAMTSVSFINQLYGTEELKRAQRQKARFINNALMVTALGAVVSDGLEDGRIVSGVGGQYNFVAQAHELAGARSIIALDATRTDNGRTTSNVLWAYGHTTIPRHLRDIIVTEYGVADLRGRSDQDVVAAMLNITDSRFQQELLDTAKRVGKIAPGYKIPAEFSDNFPEKIQAELETARKKGLLPQFPLGTEMTATEVRLVSALQKLKAIAHSRPRVIAAAARTAMWPVLSPEERKCLERLNLDQVGSMAERIMRCSLLWAMRT
jgi:acyl-CoA hydrolase